ncbi:sugar ABC transporter permease [Lachnobacterium bovis]|uniref:Arabinogalactan oligomer / maltooligosaccharide transport system permease protein n=1 Tax=Lachnobacterium bovis TaxID=140626 RepID=A0A1H9SMX6_9FIRM|nr:ABC transporter permease subunit [Lachnobacterium bovis]SER86277.1 arabinogalactan oligomer / maltooligosaccharide transport system permease protein [Lachnobacterium bovis]
MKRKVKNIIIHVILAILAVIWLFPIFWVVMTSFRKESGVNINYFFPKELTFDNYTRLFTDTQVINFPRMFVNTLIISIFSCIIATTFVLCTSYCMSRLRFKMRKPFMNLAMILGLFPAFMSMVAVYFILKLAGLTEGGLIRVALVLVYSAGAGAGFYIAKGFFDTVPKSLTEAAILDGCTQFQVFYKIICPLSKPIIVYTILTSFLGPWLDFIFVKVIVGAKDEYWTVSVGLYNMLEREFIQKWYTSWAAGAVLVSIPIAILFLIMQRFYVDGMSGAVKG